MTTYDQDHRSGWIRRYMLAHPDADQWAILRAWLEKRRQARAAKQAALIVCVVALLVGCGPAPAQWVLWEWAGGRQTALEEFSTLKECNLAKQGKGGGKYGDSSWYCMPMGVKP